MPIQVDGKNRSSMGYHLHSKSGSTVVPFPSSAASGEASEARVFDGDVRCVEPLEHIFSGDRVGNFLEDGTSRIQVGCNVCWLMRIAGIEAAAGEEPVGEHACGEKGREWYGVRMIEA